MTRKFKKAQEGVVEGDKAAKVELSTEGELNTEQENALVDKVEESSQSHYHACGARLRLARIEQGLSTQAVAKQLRLSNKQIEALEQDDFSVLPEPTIVKGFIRNYAKLLNISAETMLSAYAEMTPEAARYAVALDLGINMKITEKPKPANTHYLLFAIFFLLGLGVWIFYQNYIKKPDTANSMVEISEVLPVFDLQMPEVVEEAVLPAMTMPEQPLETPPGDETKTLLVTEKKRLEFNVTQDTWLSVVNQSGVEVYNKTLYAGNRDVVDVFQPLEVVVGNARGATLIVNGKSVDLAAYTRANVARVRLNQ